MKVPPLVHFLAQNATRVLLLLIFVGIPATAFYLREVGIGFGAKEVLGRALSSESLEVTIQRLALDPFAGILAKDVLIRETGGDRRVLAQLSDLAVSLNLSELMKRRVTVDKLSLRNAGVSIPVDDDPRAPRVEIAGVSAEVLFLGDQVRLSRFDGKVEGIHVQLTGQFLNPQSFHLPPPSQGPKTEVHREKLVQFLSELARLQFPKGPPVLSADLEADLSDLSTFAVNNLIFHSGPVQARGWSLEEIDIQAEYSNGLLKLPRLLARDATGTMEISADWVRSTGTLEAAVISTLQPLPFLKLLTDSPPALRELSFPIRPEFQARVLAQTEGPKPSVRVTGMVRMPELEFKGVALKETGFNFAWKDGTFYVRDLHVASGRGVLEGKVWIAPNDFRLVAKNSIPPTRLLNLFDEKTREFIANMEFKDLPDVSVSLQGTKPDFASLSGQGHLKLGRTAMRGSWVDSAEANFEIGDRCVTYRNMLITRGEGRGTGTFAYDVGRQEARLTGIRSTLVPKDLLMWIDPKIADAVAPYQFRSAPTTLVEGMVHLKDATKNNLSVGIESAAGLDYQLLGKTLRFGKTSAQVNVIGTKVRADVKRSTLMGGEVNLRALVSIDPKDPTFGADVKLNRVNFAQLTKLYFGYDDSKGVMSGRYQFDARTGQENLMRGKGSIRVEDGNVFAIPVLGPFSEILGTLLPGAGYQTARLATADFTVANEIINTGNLVIEGAGFSMIGAGDIHFMTSQLEMSMRVNAKGIPGVVFYPVSKLFEYISTGTVADPQWRPKIIPRFGNGAPEPTPKPSTR